MAVRLSDEAQTLTVPRSFREVQWVQRRMNKVIKQDLRDIIKLLDRHGMVHLMADFRSSIIDS